MIGLSAYMWLSAIIFIIGMVGFLTRRSIIIILMSIELMLNAVNINFVAINEYIHPSDVVGQLFAIFVLVVAAAEVSVGLALIISIYRQRQSVNLNDFNLLKW